LTTLPELAAALANQPLWGEVTVSGTGTVFAEPCIKQFGMAANRSKALAAGTPARPIGPRWSA
jgi:hypothetical protein